MDGDNSVRAMRRSRAFFLIGGVLGAVGCSVNTPIDDVRRAYTTQSGGESGNALLLSRDSRVSAVPVPYSQAAVSINGGEAGRMVLETVQQGVQKWIAVDGRTIWLESGRIVGTQGFQEDILRSSFLGERKSPVDAVRRPSTIMRSAMYVEPVGGRIGAVIEYEFAADDSAQAVQTGRGLRRWVEVRERAQSPLESWENTYWIDQETGLIELSFQRVPGTEQTVRMRRLYPAVASHNE